MIVYDKTGNQIDIATNNVINSQLITTDYIDSVDVNMVRIIGKIMIINFRGRLSKNIPDGGIPILFLPNGYTCRTAQMIGGMYYGSQYRITNGCFGFFANNNEIRIQELGSGNYIHINGVICILE